MEDKLFQNKPSSCYFESKRFTYHTKPKNIQMELERYLLVVVPCRLLGIDTFIRLAVSLINRKVNLYTRIRKNKAKSIT